MYVIGFAGQAQNGKDTAADHLRVALNDAMAEDFWQRTAFAKNVKRIFCETFNKDYYFVEKWKVIGENPPGLDMTVRKALQFIGDGFRQIQGNIWVDLMFRDHDTPRIISDARYINELRAIKIHNGFVVVVARPGCINDDPNGSEAQIRPLAEWAIKNKDKAHMSVKTWVDFSDPQTPPEAELVDYIIVNDGTKEELMAKVETILVPAITNFFKQGGEFNAVH